MAMKETEVGCPDGDRSCGSAQQHQRKIGTDDHETERDIDEIEVSHHDRRSRGSLTRKLPLRLTNLAPRFVALHNRRNRKDHGKEHERERSQYQRCNRASALDGVEACVRCWSDEWWGNLNLRIS